MRFMSDSLGLSTNEFALLRDLIQDRTGLCYGDGSSGTLADKLSPRVVENGFDTFLDYYYLLKYDERGREEWPKVFDALSVPETFFWREVEQIRALASVIVPEYASSRQPGPFRIWSTACASGEEPLSIAMALDQAGLFDRVPIEIWASDGSPAAIGRAEAGLYRERSFRALPGHLRSRYFKPVQGGERVDPALHRRIRWLTANLMDEETVRPLAHAHAIFCRNIFIYFSPVAVRKTVQLLAEHMAAPGYLFLGASESLLRVSSSFTLTEVAGAFVYVRS